MTTAPKLLIGTAGVPHKATSPTTLAGIQQIPKLGLDCMEVEFVKGVKMGSDLARDVHKAAVKNKVALSAHAPYYINLNSPEEGKRLASQERLLNSARVAEMCGARNVVFHPGYYGRNTPEQAFITIKKGIEEIVSILKKERTQVTLRPETMGKKSQFGSLEEILQLCREVDGILPCVDFSHIHARTGGLNSYSKFIRVLKKIQKKLGDESLKNIHFHISGVEYTDKGELRHKNLKNSDFHYEEWIQALKDMELAGMVICESPNLEKDAQMLKKLYTREEAFF